MAASEQGSGSTRIHEQDFCAQIAKWAVEIFKSEPTSPFADVRVEGFGSGKQQRKRKDLRFYDKQGKLSLTGEVKLPGTGEGGSPYANDLIQDAQSKADNANARYFFTWNVNKFVLWDRSLRRALPSKRPGSISVVVLWAFCTEGSSCCDYIRGTRLGGRRLCWTEEPSVFKLESLLSLRATLRETRYRIFSHGCCCYPEILSKD